jgi:hypothetical protein
MINPHFPRTDLKTAEVVRAGIALDKERGAANAWTYMESQGVPLPVIKRVLSDPAQRRIHTLQ